MKFKIHVLCECFLLICLGGFGCSTTTIQKSSRLPAEQNGEPYKTTKKINQVWLAEGFDFTGYDVLSITPTITQVANSKTTSDPQRLSRALNALPKSLFAAIGVENIFPNITLDASKLSPALEVLHLNTSIVKFDPGNSVARYVLSYGAGMPYIQIKGEALHKGQSKFKFVLGKKGKWLGTGFESQETIQDRVCHELANDLAEFMRDIAHHEAIAYED